MKRIALLAAAALVLAGCQQGTAALTAAGVAPTTAAAISADTLAAGTLFCQYNGVIAAVANIKVNNASATAIAAACSVVSPPPCQCLRPPLVWLLPWLLRRLPWSPTWRRPSSREGLYAPPWPAYPWPGAALPSRPP